MSTLRVNPPCLDLCIGTAPNTSKLRSAKTFTWMPAKQAIKATNIEQKVGSNWRGFYLLLTFWKEIFRV